MFDMDRFAERLSRPISIPVEEGEARVFIPSGWTEPPKPALPTPAPLIMSTLTGLIDCIRHEALAHGEVALHVESPEKVTLIGTLESEDVRYRRKVYAMATTGQFGTSPLNYGTFYEAETFFIMLQSLFTPLGDRDSMLTLIASIRDSSVREIVDSGVSQEVKTARGVALVGTDRVPPQVVLAPYRTFRELDQPTSRFIFRMKSSNDQRPHCALFEAEGAGWRIEAIKRIQEFLSEKVPDVTIIA